MMDDKKKKEDELLSHNYDGIEEYDNDLPKWWQWLFVVTIVFGLVYVVYYHLGPGMSQEEVLVQDLGSIEKKKQLKLEMEPKHPAADVLDLASLVKDPALIAKGKEVYVGKCAACHRVDGGGMIGPNLTDNFWLHGSSLEKIKFVIENGVLEKGMLAWKGVISDADINSVLAYIVSIKGSNPENPKEPQGTE